MGLNAQTSVPLFTAGEVLTAANQNISAGTGVPVFATTTTRDAAFGGTGEKVLAEGQVCYIEAATKKLQIYDGTTWRPLDVGAAASYTPTVSSITGSITTASATGRFTTIGRFCFVYFSATITSNGTGGTAVVLTIPQAFASTIASNTALGVARETAVTGNQSVVLQGAGTTVQIFTPTNGYPGGTGYILNGSFSYEVA